MGIKVIDIEWSMELPPDERCGYNHVLGATPLGEFGITWKSWKDYPSFDIDESPFGYIGSEMDLGSAKALAQGVFNNKILECLSIQD